MPRDAVVHKVNPYELHGVRYYQLFLAYTDAPDMLQQVRLPHDAVYASPADGDPVTVEAILSMVTEVRKREPQP
jgi:hypothetical protein